MHACMHNDAYQSFSVESEVLTCQSGHASCPSWPDKAEWMHAIILWAPMKSEKSQFPLWPPFKAACFNSGFITKSPLSHSHQVSRRKNQSTVCVFILGSICYWNLKTFCFYSYLWVIGACSPLLSSNIAIYDKKKRKFMTEWTKHNHWFIILFLLVCCLLVACPGCLQTAVKVC